jgi:hypothetical protein
MSDFTLCENGHYFPNTMEKCPYCPHNNEEGYEEDELDFEEGNSLAHTQIFGEAPELDLGRTQIFTHEHSPMPTGGASPSTGGERPNGRKLVGWLVSFTLDPNGVDFKLYEGRNIIGKDQACDIVIGQDPAISGKHLTILYRMGYFKFKDEFSTNGTFINDVFEEEGNLQDGDLIKIGETILKFRTIA